MSFRETEAQARPAAIAKVTYFVTTVSSHRADGSSRTQVWLSIPLRKQTNARDVVVACFKHAIERLGGAKLDAHPTKMLVFAQSHGEFIRIDDLMQPLLENDTVCELVEREGREVITMALISEKEFQKYNPAGSSSASAAVTAADGKGDDREASTTGVSSSGPSATNLISNTSFHGRTRAASILPEALGHDPLSDKRLRTAGSPNTANSSSSSAAAVGDGDSSLQQQQGSPLLSNDSFMEPFTPPTTRGPQHGTVVIEYISPFGSHFSTEVEYPLGALCRDVMERAVDQFVSGAIHDERLDLEAGLLPVRHSLMLLYRAPAQSQHSTLSSAVRQGSAASTVRTFMTDDVVPISRGGRKEKVRLYLAVDPSKVGMEATDSRKQHRSSRSRSNSQRDGERRRQHVAALRLAGSAASLHSVVVRSTTGKRELDASDLGSSMKKKLELFNIKYATWAGKQDAEGSAANPGQHRPMKAAVEGADIMCSLLEEESKARLELVSVQCMSDALQSELKSLDKQLANTTRAVSEKQHDVQSMKEVIVEGTNAKRDNLRLEQLISWMTNEVDSSRERQRALTRQLFELHQQDNSAPAS